MKVFICTDHETVYPVGGASIVVAHDMSHAWHLLKDELEKQRLHNQPFTLVELDLTREYATILCNGDY